MFEKRWSLCRLFGIPVRIDFSWFFLAVLVTWSLARGFFPELYPALPEAIYWSMGILGALGLFASILLHEVSHALVARRFGLQIEGITLFIFGGVAEMAEEPKSARGEFFMAIAGPLASGFLAVFFFMLARLLEALTLPTSLTGVIAYLALINGILAIFNLIPAFPMDGGRVLRAILWYRREDLRSATHTASRAGDIFGLVMIFLGLLSILSGQIVGGIWWCLIGLFVRQAARQSYQQVLMRQVFMGHPVSAYMTRAVVTVPWKTKVGAFITDSLYPHHHDLYPVVREGRLVGYLLTCDVLGLPTETRNLFDIGKVMRPLSSDITIASNSDALDALAQMRRSGNSRLLVFDDERLAGVITLKDLLDLFALKIDLGEID